MFDSVINDYDDLGDDVGYGTVGIGKKPYLDPRSQSRTATLSKNEGISIITWRFSSSIVEVAYKYRQGIDLLWSPKGPFNPGAVQLPHRHPSSNSSTSLI